MTLSLLEDLSNHRRNFQPVRITLLGNPFGKEANLSDHPSRHPFPVSFSSNNFPARRPPHPTTILSVSFLAALSRPSFPATLSGNFFLPTLTGKTFPATICVQILSAKPILDCFSFLFFYFQSLPSDTNKHHQAFAQCTCQRPLKKNKDNH